ncbi:MAG: FG-GAP-like repeat-containing protein [Salinibacter sp.]|uniref:FG-GAP-like repeat-containing protein n=1 Tax=Salinibacter sp. TaxID=2065818 RepID=UPI0035D4C083
MIAATETDGATSVSTADLDGDGDKDALSASKDNKIAWYENRMGESEAGPDGFGSQQVITTNATEAWSVQAADLDGDGDRDVLSASLQDDKIAWYENQIGESGADSDGFGPQQVITTNADGARSVYATDIDGDGDKDVLSVSQNDDKVAWYENQVGGSGADDDGFSDQLVITTDADLAFSAHAADLDGDGDKDVLSASQRDDKIAWYENQIGESGADSDGFGPQQVITTNTNGARSVYASDLDGDGDKDVLSVFSFGDTIAWHENQIGESESDSDGFGPQKVITTSATAANAVTASDIDGDGDKDALSGSNNLSWYENQIGESGADSDGFGSQQVITTNASAQSVSTTDLNGDNAPDALFASLSGDKIAWYENQIGENESDSDGFGDQHEITTSVTAAQSVHAADIDGDEDKDVLSASADDNKIAWYENQVEESGADSDGFGRQQVISTSAGGASSVYAADLDGDGDKDILSASGADDKIAWYENQVGQSGADSDGFGRQQVISTSAGGASSVYAADLDGDSDPDVLSASQDDDKIAWYENQIGESGATDSFGAQQVIIIGVLGAQSVFAADLDGDSDPDVLSASEDDDEVAWYENQIGESGADDDGFGDQKVLPASVSRPKSVFAADLDGDGDKDALSVSSSIYEDDKVVWNENKIGENGGGDDGFGGPQTISTNAVEAQSVYATDLNGDESQDILSASSDDDKIAWYENQVGESGADSDGFGSQQVISTSAGGASSVYAADLDGDSEPDVISASADDNKITWYENTEGVLPVEMAGFDARAEGEKVRMSWQTASETGNARFEVQRRAGERANGGEGAWTTVGSVEGAGTTSEAQSYRFTDADLPYAADRLEYRLRQVDTDGSAHLSKTVTVERGVTEVELLGTFPNPVQSRATLRYALPEKQEVTIRLYDVLGRRVRTLVQTETEGRHERAFDTSDLSSGVYFLRLQVGGQTRTQKLTVVR